MRSEPGKQAALRRQDEQDLQDRDSHSAHQFFILFILLILSKFICLGAIVH